ncbi:MAG: translation initiation factor 2 [Lachnospiraceae bacterium]|nr:translation initiation factor 2 [Lachnospiraceae bacterium]
MKGKHKVVISNNRLHYEFEIKRNITIIQGDSATGKTTLINMIRQENELGSSSGVNISCDVPCVVVEGRNWKVFLQTISNSIVFIDEGSAFIKTEEFAGVIRNSGNYYVLITRENLYNLPYSVEEIYGIHSSGKYHDTRKVYQQMYQIYSPAEKLPIKPETVLVEDSNSGFDFFNAVCKQKGKDCISAGGKSNIKRILAEMQGKQVCVIADGAAIGAEMRDLFILASKNLSINLYLPESFEWLILNSNVIADSEIRQILDHAEDYVESNQFFSWERYFTKLLVDKTQNSYLKYQKTKLNENYLRDKIKDQITQNIKGVDFEI